MIKITQIPMCIMDAAKFAGTVTENETVKDVIDWILAGKEFKHGSIEISFFNNSEKEPIEMRYQKDSLIGRIDDEILDRPVIELGATQGGRTMSFNFDISVMDPESTEYSGLRDEDDDDEWEE